MKVLFCCGSSLDYGLDVLFDGLNQVLGSENIFELPHKPNFHGVMEKKLQWYPCFFDYPIQATDNQKVEMLKNNEFDLILVGCRQDTDYLTPELRTLLIEKSNSIPIFLVDQDDEAGINTNLMNELNGQLYFKREHSKKYLTNSKIIPLNFSYANKYLPATISGERINTLFWAGKEIPSRTPFLQVCREIKGRPFYGYQQERYRQKLLINTIGLNLKGRGNDTVRYYEIPAHGALLFTEKPEITIKNDFKDGQTAVMFETPEEMVEKLNYYLENQDFTDKIRLAGHQWFNKYHTSKIRAEQMIAKIIPYL